MTARITGYHRVAIEAVRPVVDGGRFAAKAAVGIPLEVSATVFLDGHDRVAAWVRFGRSAAPRPTDPAPPRGWREVALVAGVNDRHTGVIVPEAIGPLHFQILGVADDYGSWLAGAAAKHAAGDDIGLELEEAARMAERRAQLSGVRAEDRRRLTQLAADMRAPRPAASRLARAARSSVVELMLRTVDRSRATVSATFPLWVDRERGAFSAWYELFPRSEGASETHSGSLRQTREHLPEIAQMGFDIVYLPPIHPIGQTARKGRNNALEALPGDPGSPWAIGAADGGHTAVHPDLGSVEDLDGLVAAAHDAGLEVALDFAAQCSPDHPWVREHPAWFRHRPDGSVKYAENPPKKYQDIVPLDFDTPEREQLWGALRDVLLYWCDHGIRVFRVDNPHTKPFDFWEWVIGEVRGRHPECLFLAEAFTRPAVMHRLAKLGFSQSYTYFTWRNQGWELRDYLRELASPPGCDYFRPNFWPNTPDILPEVLQSGKPASFRLRALLAAIGGPSWGIYRGFEHGDHLPVRPGSEEYLNSEKYQYLPRSWDPRDAPLVPLIRRLNAIRRRHRDVLVQLGTTVVHPTDNDALLCFSRTSLDRTHAIVVIANLDPHWAQTGFTWLDMEALGLADDARYEVYDELMETTYIWQGRRNFVRLDPAIQPGHVMRLRSL